QQFGILIIYEDRFERDLFVRIRRAFVEIDLAEATLAQRFDRPVAFAVEQYLSVRGFLVGQEIGDDPLKGFLNYSAQFLVVLQRTPLRDGVTHVVYKGRSIREPEPCQHRLVRRQMRPIDVGAPVADDLVSDGVGDRVAIPELGRNASYGMIYQILAQALRQLVEARAAAFEACANRHRVEKRLQRLSLHVLAADAGVQRGASHVDLHVTMRARGSVDHAEDRVARVGSGLGRAAGDPAPQAGLAVLGIKLV